MGEARPGRRDSDGGRPLTRAVRVVPDVPSFSVDNGFWYSVPDHLIDRLDVGSIVRIPLSGRRVRGWVVERAERESEMKDVLGASGVGDVFDTKLLTTLVWAAEHYVAPVSVLLGKASPPNLPKLPKTPFADNDVERPSGSHQLVQIADRVASGRKVPTQVVVGAWQRLDWLRSFMQLLTDERSVVVVAGTAAEVKRLAAAATDLVGDRVTAVEGADAAELTNAWSRAQFGGQIVIGTPRVALWSHGDAAMVIVLEEARRAMKERQTPTLHVRDIIRRRGLVEDFTPVFFGPTPSVEVLATGPNVVELSERPWPLVEIVDRSSDDRPGSLLADATVAAIRGMASRGEDSFVLTTHNMIEPMSEELDRRLSDTSRVGVGTERDLASLNRVALAVAPYPPAISGAHGYRGSEEVLRVLARLANVVAPGAGHRLLIQTMDPDSGLMTALRRGEPIPYLERVLVERAQVGAPPATEVMAVEIRDKVPADADSVLRELGETEVIGPLEIDEGMRWLLQGSLLASKRSLRPIVGRWRESGSTVRVDADPIDL